MFIIQSSMDRLLIFNIGGSEFFLIILVVLLFFGAKGIPDIAKSLGRASREFKDAMNGVERELHDAVNTDASLSKKEEPQKMEDGTTKEKLENGK